MTTIIGIDPGSQITGYGVITMKSREYRYVTSGCIRIAKMSVAKQLHHIFAGINEIIKTYQPNEAAIEQIFIHHNAGGALKLGQARGAAIVALAQHDLSVAEYSARHVKQAVVGYGAADKQQVQHMVTRLLKLTDTPREDAADALAVAMCHAQQMQLVF